MKSIRGVIVLLILILSFSFVKACIFPVQNVSQAVSIAETRNLILHHHPFFRAMTPEGGRNYLEMQKSGRSTFYRLADTFSGDLPVVDVYMYHETMVILKFNKIRSFQKFKHFLLSFNGDTISTLTYDENDVYALFLGKGEDQIQKVTPPWYRLLDGRVYPEYMFDFRSTINTSMIFSVEEMVTNTAFAGTLRLMGNFGVIPENNK